MTRTPGRRSTFSGITVPLDGSPLAESALPYALALGDALDMPVTLLHVVPPSRLALDYQLRYDASEEATLLAHAAEVLESRAKTLATAARRVETHTAIGDPAEEIVRYAEASNGRCIVMSTHGAGGILHWAFGSIARKVLTTATAPTLVVRRRAIPERPDEPATIRTLLLPLDGSELAREAVPVARDLAKALGAAVTLVRIVPIPTAMHLSSPYAPVIAQPYLDEALAAEREAATADLTLAAEELHAAGIAATTVVKRWVLGSVAERLVEASHTPVLIVRGGIIALRGVSVRRGGELVRI